MATTETERSDFSAEMATVTERLQDSANARTVFGDPVERDGRTVIPVARVAYGFGGGFGDQQGGAESSEGKGGGTGAAYRVGSVTCKAVPASRPSKYDRSSAREWGVSSTVASRSASIGAVISSSTTTSPTTACAGAVA